MFKYLIEFLTFSLRENVTCLKISHPFIVFFPKMKLFLLLFILNYYTFRCNAFVVNKRLLDSEIFSLNPAMRMGVEPCDLLPRKYQA